MSQHYQTATTTTTTTTILIRDPGKHGSSLVFSEDAWGEVLCCFAANPGPRKALKLPRQNIAGHTGPNFPYVLAISISPVIIAIHRRSLPKHPQHPSQRILPPLLSSPPPHKKLPKPVHLEGQGAIRKTFFSSPPAPLDEQALNPKP